MSQTAPFFLFYDARSGSTYLANLLIKHAKIAIPPETNFVTSIFAKFPSEEVSDSHTLNYLLDIIYGDRKFSDLGIKRKDLEAKLRKNLPCSVKEVIISIWDTYKTRHFPSSIFFGIKKGSYLDHYKKIKHFFPQSKFIGIIRDGRAVFSSKKYNIYSGTGKPFEKNPFQAAKEWCRCLFLLHEVKNKYPEDTLLITYEQLISDPESTLQKIATFLKIELSDDNVNQALGYEVSSRYKNLHKNIQKKPLKSRKNAWQVELSKNEIFAFESVAHQQLMDENYAPVNTPQELNNAFRKILLRLYFNIMRF